MKVRTYRSLTMPASRICWRQTSAANTRSPRHAVNNYWKGHWIKHPAQINLHGLPADLVTKILLEFVEVAQRAESPPIRNYEDWLRASFGKTFAETFPMQYTIKYHTTTAANMNTEWIGPRLYRPKLEEVFRGALAAELGRRALHQRLSLSKPRRLCRLPGAVSEDRRHQARPQGRSDRPEGAPAALREWRDGRLRRLVSSIPLPELVPMIVGAPRETSSKRPRGWPAAKP